MNNFKERELSKNIDLREKIRNNIEKLFINTNGKYYMELMKEDVISSFRCNILIPDDFIKLINHNFIRYNKHLNFDGYKFEFIYNNYFENCLKRNFNHQFIVIMEDETIKGSVKINTGIIIDIETEEE